MKQKYFKVKIGYDKSEFISIDETELAMAMRAQITGKVAVFKGGTVAGNHIMAIVPDWNKELGYSPVYVLTAGDYNDISSKRKMEYNLCIQNTGNEVTALLAGKPVPPRIEAPVRTFQGMRPIGEMLPKNGN